MRTYYFLLCCLALASCSTTQPAAEQKGSQKKNPPPQQQVYRGAYTRVHDLVHMKLEVRPDWEKMQMDGQATLTLHPHFYSSDSLVLNARGMDIFRVALIKSSSDTVPLVYTYDKKLISIRLDRTYTKEEKYTVFISYKARPEDLESGGSTAIESDKGLYFINADGLDTEKPKQIWTQGETESNSVWFPTLEDPQQRMTQEISITVDSIYKTLSNGMQIRTRNHGDGMRTDTWKQTLPCPPYLTMIAVGDYAVVKDRWRDLAVDYYVEHAYEPYAKMIFGHTPEMMDFFSRKFGVDFPWEKYAQIVVRDFVSGAMENTTAVVHIEGLQQTPREYLDYNYEDYIAHELAHHWFGDLVTCESWSNVVLNEGFANYAEYLWREYKFGRDDAEYLNQKYLNYYFYSAAGKDPDVVRYHYADREDMYDQISYQKGGHILHMLRKYTGDEAFYASLRLYLLTHSFAPVEIHDLRLAFEKITGEDLNWFFDEWFLNKGYPRLVMRYEYPDSLHKQRVTIEQTQDFSKNPLYRIPMAIDIYVSGKAERHMVVLDKAVQTFEFEVSAKPDLVNVDAEKMLICTKKDNKPRAQFVYQYYHAPLYLDRYEAVTKIGDGIESGSAESRMMLDAMKDPFWNIRLAAIRNSGDLAKDKEPGLRELLEQLAKSDPKSQVRLGALKALMKDYYDEKTEVILAEALKDSSYLVIQTAFSQLAEKNQVRAREVAPSLEKESSNAVMEELAGFYTLDARPESNDFFRNSVHTKLPEQQERIIEHYGNYLSQQNFRMREEGILWLDSLSRNSQPWYIRLASLNSMSDLQEELNKRLSNPSNDKQVLTATDLAQMKQQADSLESRIRDIKQKETNKKLLEYYKK